MRHMQTNIHIINHPIISDKLARMRSANTPCPEFKRLAHEVSLFLGYEASRNTALRDAKTKTPLEETDVKRIGENVCIVPILRAGMGMLDAMLAIFPEARVGHLGMYRDHKTLQPVEYYCNLPEDLSKTTVYIIDPMLATGGSAVAAVDAVKKRGAKRIKSVNIFGAPAGLDALSNTHPDVEIYLGALDRCLNENGYILPGVGDAGDRIFGTL